MYSGLANTKYVVPLCKESWEIRAFLDIPNSLFKIVSDLRNIKSLLTYNDHKKITQIYIYNEKEDKGISNALSYKTESRKVKGIYNDL